MANIDEKILIEERKVLEADFNTMNDRIKQVEKDLGTMKSNLNAVLVAHIKLQTLKDKQQLN